jgi:hypothetical protein
MADGTTVTPQEARKLITDLRAQASRLESLLAEPSDALFPILSESDLCAELGPIPWVCEALRMAPGLPVLIAGYGYAGKTISMQSVALSVAAGRDVWGLYGNNSGPVGHIDWEQGKRTTVGRYQRLAHDAGINLRALRQNNHLRISIFPTSYLSTKNIYDPLCRFNEGLKLCLYDSLTAALPGVDENDSRVGEYMYLLGRVSEATGSVQVTIHHSRKPQDGDEGDPRRAIRGSTALYNGSSTVFVLIGKKNQPVRWCCEKDRHSGNPTQDFFTRVEDTHNGNGVRIVHLEAEQVSGANEARARAELCETIYQGIMRFPGMNASSLASALRKRQSDVRMAITILEQRGAVANRGSSAKPSYFAKAEDEKKTQ